MYKSKNGRNEQMNQHNESDWLDHLFQQLPEEELPVTFRSNVMDRVMKAETRRQRRVFWMEIIALTLAVLFLIGLSIAALLYVDFQLPKWPEVSLNGLVFYSYIGFLSLLLLGADHLFRRYYQSKHPSSR